jgi:hypothetical protein
MPPSVNETPAQPDLSSFQAISAAGTNSASSSSSEAGAGSASSQELEGSLTKPVIPSGVSEYFLPVNYNLAQAFKTAAEPMPVDSRLEAVLYRPVLLASAKVRFLDRRYGIDNEVVRDALVDNLDHRSAVRWDDFPYDGPGMDKLENAPSPQARFVTPDAPYGDAKLLAGLQKDFTDWVFRTTQVTVRSNQALKVFAGPDVSPAEFRTACSDAARKGRDAEIGKQTAAIDRQIAGLQGELAREERKLNQNQMEYDNRKREETGNMLELGAGFFGLGRKKSITTQFSKNRLSQEASGHVDESKQTIQQLKRKLAELQQKRQQVVPDAEESWGAKVSNNIEIPIKPKKSDVYVEVFGVAWQPFYIFRGGNDLFELPAFGSQ